MAYASVIGSSAVIRGNVRGDSSLEILGRIEGDVGVTGDLSLGREAVVVGTITGARILIGGSVQGDVTATEAVLIAETGRVVGDLSAPRIGMSEGAHVRGSVRTDGGSAAPPSNSRSLQRSSESRASESRASESRTSESRAAEPRLSEPRPVPAPTERSAPRPVAAAASALSMPASAPKPMAKKTAPPPIIVAPRPGARARKKLARR